MVLLFLIHLSHVAPVSEGKNLLPSKNINADYTKMGIFCSHFPPCPCQKNTDACESAFTACHLVKLEVQSFACTSINRFTVMAQINLSLVFVFFFFDSLHFQNILPSFSSKTTFSILFHSGLYLSDVIADVCTSQILFIQSWTPQSIHITYSAQVEWVRSRLHFHS